MNFISVMRANFKQTKRKQSTAEWQGWKTRLDKAEDGEGDLAGAYWSSKATRDLFWVRKPGRPGSALPAKGLLWFFSQGFQKQLQDCFASFTKIYLSQNMFCIQRSQKHNRTKSWPQDGFSQRWIRGSGFVGWLVGWSLRYHLYQQSLSYMLGPWT